MFGFIRTFINLLLITLYHSLCFSQLVSDFQLIQLTDGQFNDQHPVFSPDGSTIAFDSDRNGTQQIFIMNLNSLEIECFTIFAEHTSNPTWFPQGNKIASSMIRDGLPQLVVLEPNKEAVNLINRNIPGKQVDFNSKGNLIVFLSKTAFSNNWDVFTYDFIYDNLNQLTFKTHDCQHPRWSPNGEWISYNEINSKKGFCKEIKTIHWYGDSLSTIHCSGKDLSDPCWSPDGFRIAYVTVKNDFYQLISIRKDGSNVITLVQNKERIFTPDWSPDSKKIVFSVGAHNNKRQIWLLSFEEE